MKLLQWCKANAMPVIAVLAAAVTAVFVPPDEAYLGYYDVKTLFCLLCVLAVVGALRGGGQGNLSKRSFNSSVIPSRSVAIIAILSGFVFPFLRSAIWSNSKLTIITPFALSPPDAIGIQSSIWLAVKFSLRLP